MSDTFDIVVDAQADFMQSGGKLYVPGAEAIIPPLREHIASLDSRGVLFTFDTHLEGDYETGEEAREFPIHCVKGTPGWQLVVDPSIVRVPVYTMEKGVFDMWHEPSLMVASQDDVSLARENFFHRLKANGVTKVRLTGVAADYCVRYALEGLVVRGFAVEVIKGLTVGIQRGIEQVVADDFAGTTVTLV